MNYGLSYRKPRPLVNVTARTSGYPWRPAKLGVVAFMTMVCYRSVGDDGQHFPTGKQEIYSCKLVIDSYCRVATTTLLIVGILWFLICVISSQSSIDGCGRPLKTSIV